MSKTKSKLQDFGAYIPGARKDDYFPVSADMYALTPAEKRGLKRDKLIPYDAAAAIKNGEDINSVFLKVSFIEAIPKTIGKNKTDKEVGYYLDLCEAARKLAETEISLKERSEVNPFRELLVRVGFMRKISGGYRRCSAVLYSDAVRKRLDNCYGLYDRINARRIKDGRFMTEKEALETAASKLFSIIDLNDQDNDPVYELDGIFYCASPWDSLRPIMKNTFWTSCSANSLGLKFLNPDNSAARRVTSGYLVCMDKGGYALFNGRKTKKVQPVLSYDPDNAIMLFDNLEEAVQYTHEKAAIELSLRKIAAEPQKKKESKNSKHSSSAQPAKKREVLVQEISEEELMNKYGLRGWQYGNYMSKNDRIRFYNASNKALGHLTDILGITERSAGFNGKLALAFGARGRGPYAGHYEPYGEVINLTKTNGLGVLAHEWCHALDNMIARNLQLKNPYASCAGDEMPEVFVDLMNTLKYGNLESDPKIIERKAAVDNCISDAVSLLKKHGLQESQKFKSDIQTLMMRPIKAQEKAIEYFKALNVPDRSYSCLINDLYRVCVLYKFDREKAMKNHMMPFYKASVEGSQSDYFTSNEEMFARAGNAYIQTKLYEKGITSSALFRDDSADNRYPTKDEVGIYAAAFEKVIDFAKQIGTLDRKEM